MPNTNLSPSSSQSNLDIGEEKEQQPDSNWLGILKKRLDAIDDTVNGFRTGISYITTAFSFTLVGCVTILLGGITFYESDEEIRTSKNSTSAFINLGNAFASIIAIALAVILATSFNLYTFLIFAYGLFAVSSLFLLVVEGIKYSIGDSSFSKKNAISAAITLSISSFIFFPVYMRALLPVTISPLIIFNVTCAAITSFLLKRLAYNTYQSIYAEPDNQKTWKKKAWADLGLVLIAGSATYIMLIVFQAYSSLLYDPHLQFALIYGLLVTTFILNLINSKLQCRYAEKNSLEELKLKKEYKHDKIELVAGIMIFLGNLVDFGYIDVIISNISNLPPFFNLPIVPNLLPFEIGLPTILILLGVFVASWNEKQREKPLAQTKTSYNFKDAIFNFLNNHKLYASLSLIFAVGLVFCTPTLSNLVIVQSLNLSVQDILMPVAIWPMILISLYQGFLSFKGHFTPGPNSYFKKYFDTVKSEAGQNSDLSHSSFYSETEALLEGSREEEKPPTTPAPTTDFWRPNSSSRRTSSPGLLIPTSRLEESSEDSGSDSTYSN